MQKPIIEIPQTNPDLVIEVHKLLGNSDSMSEIEREELANRIKAMSEAEMVLTAKLLPDDILMNEIARRYYVARDMLHDVKCALRTEK